MMEGVASKFACLQDDDSTDWVAPKEKGKKSKPANEPKPNSNKSKKKNKANNEAKELQNLAFASKKSKNKNKSKSPKPDNKSSTKQEAQYEEWKQKDEELVDDAFAQDVEKALMLSKLDFEEQKATKKILDAERTRLAVLEAAKKPITMSLGQFQKTEPERNHDSNLHKPCDIQNQTDFVKSKPLVIDKKDTLLTNGNKKSDDNFEGSAENDNGQFFTNLQQDTINLINHEKKQSTRNMSVTKNGVALNESALMKQFKDTVAIKDIEIAKLQSDNETLKSELMKIKNRYKGIRQILDQAELKEKVEILIEVEKLRKVRDEMSENISSLTKELEQSKTREHLLGDELRSLQGYKIIVENMKSDILNMPQPLMGSPKKTMNNIDTSVINSSTKNNIHVHVNESTKENYVTYCRQRLLQISKSSVSIEWPKYFDKKFINEKGKWDPGLWADSFVPTSIASPMKEEKVIDNWGRNGGNRESPTLKASNDTSLLDVQGFRPKLQPNNSWPNVMAPRIQVHHPGETFRQNNVDQMTFDFGKNLKLNQFM